MSDYTSDNPYLPGTPEYQKFTGAQLDALKIAPPAWARGALAEVLPPVTDSTLPTVARAVPGALTGLYSTAEAARGFMNSHFPPLQRLDNAMGIGGPLPYADVAQKANESSKALAAQIIPKVATTPEGMVAEKAMQDVGSSLAIPSARLPAAARTIANIINPNSAAPILSPLIGGAASVAADTMAHAAPASAQPPLPSGAPGVPPLDIGGPPPIVPPPLAPDTGDTAWSYLQVAGAGFAGLVALKAGPAVVRGAIKAGEFAKLRRTFQDSEKFNAFEAGKGADSLSGGTPPPAPLPGYSAGVAATEAIADKDAVMKSYHAAIQPDETAAAKARAKAGRYLTDESAQSRLQTFTATGYDKETGIKGPSLDDHWTRVGQFTPEQGKVFDTARQAADELDNRVRNFNKMKKEGGTIDDADLRVWYKDKDSDELRKVISDARTDPRVARELDDINAVHRQLIDMGEAYGRFTKEAASNLKGTHPNYLPIVDIEGRIKNPFTERNIEPGGGSDVMSIRPSEADKQHVQAIIKELEQNSFHRQVVEDSIAYQDRNATMGPDGVRQGPAEIVEIMRGPDGALLTKPADDGSSISVFVNGVEHHVRIKQPILLRLMKEGPKPLGAFIDGMNVVRQYAQSGTTGVAALAGGRFFPVVNAARDTIQGSITRPKGTAYGLGDALVSKVTGGRVGLPGDFATALPFQAYGIIADAASVMAGRVGRLLTPGFDNPANNFMRWVFGDAITDAFHKKMQAQYYASVLFDARQRGLVRSAGYGTEETPVKQIGALNKTLGGKNVSTTSSPLNNSAPALFRANDPRIPFTNIRIKGLGGALVPFLRFNEFTHDMFNIFNDSAKMHYLRLNEGSYPLMKWANKKLDPDVMGQYTRELAGDMALRGKSMPVRTLAATVPYANPMIQGMSGFGKSISARPVGTYMGIIHALGTLSLASVYTALLHGQDAIDHQQKQLSSAELARNAWLYHPDHAPEAGVQIPIPQELQPLYPIFLQWWHDAWALGSHFMSPESSMFSIRGLTDHFNQHITHNTADASLAGLDTLTQVGAPPLVDAAAGIAGKRVVPFSVKALTAPLPDGTNPLQRFVAPAGSGSPMAPDRPGPTAEGALGTVAQGLIKSGFGILGDTVVDLGNHGKLQLDNGSTTTDALHSMLDMWQQKYRDKNPIANNMLWVNEAQLSGNTQLVERTNYKLRALEVTKGALTDIQQGGLTRRGGEALPDADTAPHKLPDDPAMRDLYVYLSQQNARIRGGVLKYAQDTNKQMKALDNVPGSSQELTRLQHNMLNTKYQERMGMVADELQDVEHEAARMLGVRHVALEHIDWGKGRDQFVR